jgi:DNA-binding CsgD family transcriptional regulator
MWEEKRGKIPLGYEIHHKCGVRSCCNVEHLALIAGKEHAILTNRERYLDRKESVLQGASIMSAKELAETYGCSERTVYRYLRG